MPATVRLTRIPTRVPTTKMEDTVAASTTPVTPRRPSPGSAAGNVLRVLLVGLFVTAIQVVRADPIPVANITWGSPTTISGVNDVDTTGTLVYAYNFGSSSVTAQTVNGVTFQPFGLDNTAGAVTVGNVTVEETNPDYYITGDTSFQELGSTAAPFSTLNAGYQGLLSTGVYASNFGNIRIDLSGLTPGENYRLQWWTNDSTVSTGPFAPFLEYFDSTMSSGASTSVTLDANTVNTNGGLGQYVIGTFTASGSAASFLLTGTGNGSVSNYNLPLINALQVRVTAVPEPSTHALVLAGLACGGYGMWRRRRRA